MSEELVVTLDRHTMDALEAAKHVSSEGAEYWLGREIRPLLGYKRWENFGAAIERAREAMRGSGIDPSQQILETTKLVRRGIGAAQPSADYFLSRGATYLIAMNSDPSKPEVSNAQTYFASQARNAELADHSAADLKRLKNRDRVKDAVKRVNDVAKDVGVTRYGLFTDAGWKGFYGMSVKQVAELKGLPEGEHIFDRAGNLELTGNAFRMELTAESLAQQPSGGEARAIRVNREIGERVRKTMVDEIGHGPEKLALEAETIKAVKARLARRPEKALTHRAEE